MVAIIVGGIDQAIVRQHKNLLMDAAIKPDRIAVLKISATTSVNQKRVALCY